MKKRKRDAKNPNLIFFSFVSFVLILIFITKPETKSPEVENDDKKALSLLFGGESSSKTSTKKSKNQSLYDTDFWKSGITGEPIEEESKLEEDTEILEKASEGNPINPQTGLPYTDEQMEQFDTLRKKFPNNSLIPKRITPEEQKAQEEEKRRVLEIQSKIVSRKATAEEIEKYIEHQKKPILDRLELLNYVLQELKDDLPDDLKKQYEETLKMNEQQLKSLDEQKNSLLKSAAP